MFNRKRMSEVQFQMDAEVLNKLKDQLGMSNSVDVSRVAFVLLAWVVDETTNGSTIVAHSPDERSGRRLVMCELERVRLEAISKAG